MACLQNLYIMFTLIINDLEIVSKLLYGNKADSREETISADIVSSLESALHKHCPSVSNPDEVGSSLINTLYNSKKKFKPPTTSTPKILHDVKILSNLRKDPSIIITKADKINSFVVMNTTDYDNEILSHLNDTITYQTITHDPTDQFTNNIINLLYSCGVILPFCFSCFNSFIILLVN